MGCGSSKDVNTAAEVEPPVKSAQAVKANAVANKEAPKEQPAAKVDAKANAKPASPVLAAQPAPAAAAAAAPSAQNQQPGRSASPKPQPRREASPGPQQRQPGDTPPSQLRVIDGANKDRAVSPAAEIAAKQQGDDFPQSYKNKSLQDLMITTEYLLPHADRQHGDPHSGEEMGPDDHPGEELYSDEEQLYEDQDDQDEDVSSDDDRLAEEGMAEGTPDDDAEGNGTGQDEDEKQMVVSDGEQAAAEAKSADEAKIAADKRKRPKVEASKRDLSKPTASSAAKASASKAKSPTGGAAPVVKRQLSSPMNTREKEKEKEAKRAKKIAQNQRRDKKNKRAARRKAEDAPILEASFNLDEALAYVLSRLPEDFTLPSRLKKKKGDYTNDQDRFISQLQQEWLALDPEGRGRVSHLQCYHLFTTSAAGAGIGAGVASSATDNDKSATEGKKEEDPALRQRVEHIMTMMGGGVNKGYFHFWDFCNAQLARCNQMFRIVPPYLQHTQSHPLKKGTGEDHGRRGSVSLISDAKDTNDTLEDATAAAAAAQGDGTGVEGADGAAAAPAAAAIASPATPPPSAAAVPSSPDDGPGGPAVDAEPGSEEPDQNGVHESDSKLDVTSRFDLEACLTFLRNQLPLKPEELDAYLARLITQYTPLDLVGKGYVTRDELRWVLFSSLEQNPNEPVRPPTEQDIKALPEPLPEGMDEDVQSIMHGTGDKPYFTFWDFANLLLSEQKIEVQPPDQLAALGPDAAGKKKKKKKGHSRKGSNLPTISEKTPRDVSREPFPLKRSLGWVGSQLPPDFPRHAFMEKLKLQWMALDKEESGTVSREQVSQFIWETDGDDPNNMPAELPKAMQEQVDLLMGGAHVASLSFWDFAGMLLEAEGFHIDINPQMA